MPFDRENHEAHRAYDQWNAAATDAERSTDRKVWVAAWKAGINHARTAGGDAGEAARLARIEAAARTLVESGVLVDVLSGCQWNHCRACGLNDEHAPDCLHTLLAGEG
jgi:hypothetical protein